MIKSNLTKIINEVAPSDVSLTEIKQHLNIYDDSDDVYLSHLLDAATAAANNYVGEFIGETELISYYSEFASLQLPYEYVSEVVSVSYMNEDGNSQIVDKNSYLLDTTSTTPNVKLKKTYSWPADVSSDYDNPVSVTFICSLGRTNMTASSVQAILMIAAELYKNRENSTEVNSNKIPFSAERLLDRVRRSFI